MNPPTGKLRHKLYLIQFQNQVPDGYGGQTAGTTATKRTFWGDVTELRSNREQDAGQQVLSKGYNIKARYSSETVENGNYIIWYGKILVVSGWIETDFRRFIEISAERREVGDDAAASLPGSFDVYNYRAAGGESEFTADVLINKNVLIVFEEGSAMNPSNTADRLQVQFVAGAGTVRFDHLLQPDARIQVLYQ